MPKPEQDVLNAALSLDQEARLRLANALLDSLNHSTSPAIDAAWLRVAHDRLDAFRHGEIDALPGEKVLEELDLEFRKRNSA